MIAQLLNLSRKFPKPQKKKKKKKVNSITLKIQRYYSYRCIKKHIKLCRNFTPPT